jgi:hypothetical protein
MRGQVCFIMRITHRSESQRTHKYILLSHLWPPQPGVPGPHIYIPQEQGGSGIPQVTGLLLVMRIEVKVILWLTISQPVWPCIRPPSGTRDQFFYSLQRKLSTDICVSFNMEQPLWWEDGSAQLLVDLASTVTLRSKSCRTLDHIVLSHLRLGSLFIASYNSNCYDGCILTRLFNM